MAQNEKPAACKRDGLPDDVRLQVERADRSDSAARVKSLWFAELVRSSGLRNPPMADVVLAALKSTGKGTKAKIAATLAAAGVELSDAKLQKCLNSNARRGRVLSSTKVRSPGAAYDAAVWRPNPDADLHPPRSDGGGPADELRVSLGRGALHLKIWRPRTADGVLRPSQDGLSLKIDCLPGLVASLAAAEAEARALGLIGGAA